jgi:hypothetical protein
MSTANEAAPILADMFATSVLQALNEEPPRTFLYGWERDALAWLKAWHKAGGKTPINHWTGTCMRLGPPPWPRKRTTMDEVTQPAR